MSEPKKIDSVTDASSHKEVGIAPLVDVTKRDWFIKDAYRQNTFEIVCALLLALILITFAIGLSKVI